MPRAVHDAGLHVHDRVAGQHAGFKAIVNRLLDGGGKLTRQGAGLEFVHDDIAFRRRFEHEFDDCVVALAAALPDETTLGNGGRGDGLAVGDLRLA